jgi:hypothetical protein
MPPRRSFAVSPLYDSIQWFSCSVQVGSPGSFSAAGNVYTTLVLPAAPRETLALQAFTHGNSCLAAGQFADATTAFHRAREIDPKHPHVTGRLAEVEQRQQAASITPLGNTTV